MCDEHLSISSGIASNENSTDHDSRPPIYNKKKINNRNYSNSNNNCKLNARISNLANKENQINTVGTRRSKRMRKSMDYYKTHNGIVMDD